jgi:hypothetical protein
LARENSKGTELELFKGRKADLTRCMLHLLSNETLLKYDLHKAVKKQGFKKTRYGTITKKIKVLEQGGYVQESGVRKTQPGQDRMLSTTDLEDSFKKMDEESGIMLLAFLAWLQSR